MAKKEVFDINKFKKSYRTVLEKTAQRIGREIEKAYESQISRFYNDYYPIVYERTGATWRASSGMQDYDSWSKYLGDLYYQAGISVGSDNIQKKVGDPYKASDDYENGTEWVFNRTWHYGIHGINKNTRRFKTRKRKNGSTYVVSWAYRQFPKNTRPAPEIEFTKAFNKIKQHKHLDEVFSEYWTKEWNRLQG